MAEIIGDPDGMGWIRLDDGRVFTLPLDYQVDNEYAEVTSLVKVNPNWTWTDGHGHQHRMSEDGVVRTLDWLPVETEFVDPWDAVEDVRIPRYMWSDEDDGVRHYLGCSECLEPVPHELQATMTVANHERQYLRVATNILINGELVTPEQFEELQPYLPGWQER